MLDINGSKVVNSYIKNSKLFIEFDNGIVLDTYKYNLIYNFNVDLFNYLSGKKINENILNVNIEDIFWSIPMINSDLGMDLEIKELIGMTINCEVYNNYISIDLVIPPKFLMENSDMFSDCVTEDEVTEHNENIITISEIYLDTKNPEPIYNILKQILTI